MAAMHTCCDDVWSSNARRTATIDCLASLALWEGRLRTRKHTHTSASLRVHALPDKLASPNARCHVSQCCQTSTLQFLTTWEGRQSQEHLKAHGKRLSEHVSACQLTKSTPFPST